MSLTSEIKSIEKRDRRQEPRVNKNKLSFRKISQEIYAESQQPAT